MSSYTVDPDKTARTEAALRESEARYRALFDRIDQGYCIVEVLLDENGAAADLIVREANRAWQDKTGLTDVVGRRMSEVAPNLERHWLDYYSHVIRTGEPRREENYMANVDRWFTAHYSSIGELGSKLVAVVFDDITERKRSEIALRESEERQAFLLKLSDAVRPLANPADIQGETTRLVREQLNAGWCYYVDWDPDKKIGLVLRDSASVGLPSLTGAHDVSDVPEFLQLLAGGEVQTVRDYARYEQLSPRIREKFTAVGFRSMMVAPLVKEGRLIASMLVGDTEIRDWSAGEVSLLVEVAERTWAAVERARAETALQASEARIRAIADLAPVLIWETDASGLVFVNRQYLDFFGADFEALQGMQWSQYLHPEDAADYLAKYAEAIASRQPYTYECRLRRADGEYRWLLTTARPHADRLVGVCADVTEMKRAEAQLADELADAEVLQIISNKLVSEPGVNGHFTDIVEAARNLMRSHAASIQELHFTRLKLTAHCGFHPDSARFWEWVDADVGSSCGRALTAGERIVVPDMEDFEAEAEDVAAYRKSGIAAVQSTPLVARSGQIVGMMSTHWAEAVAVDAINYRFFDILARLAADFIERTRAEAALRAREAELARVQQIGQVAGIDIDLVNGMTTPERSEDYKRVHGLAPAIMSETHQDWLNRLHPDDRDYADKALRDALAGGGTIYDSEYRIVRPDNGEVRWIAANGEIERDADGRPLRLVGAHIDITARRLAEETLRESEARHRAALEKEVAERTAELRQSRDLMQATMDSSMDMIQVFEAVRDATGQIVDFRWVLNNHTSEQAYGDVVGKSLLENNPGVVEAGIFDAFRQVVETGVPHQSERHYVHEQFNGWYYQSAVKLGDGIATTTSNITARKAAEAEVLRLLQEVADARLKASEDRLRRVLDGMDEGFGVLAPDFTILEHNQEALRLDGRSREEIIGRSHWEVYPESETSEVGRLLRAAMAERRAVTVEHLYSWQDGRALWLEMRAYPTDDGMVAVFWRDVTARHEAQDALRQSEERLKLAIGVGELATWDWNIETGKVVWSDLHYQLQGYGPGEIEPTYEAWAARVHPDDLPVAEAALIVARDDHKPYAHEFRTRLPDGRVRWMAAQGQYFYNDAGQPVRMIGAMQDVTERKWAIAALRASETRQSFLLELSDTLGAEADADAAQRAVARLLGKHLGADRAGYAALEPQAEDIVVVRDWVNRGIASIAGPHHLEDFQGFFTRPLNEAGLMAVADATIDMSLTGDLKGRNVGAALGFVITVDGRFSAAVFLHQKTRRDWTEAETALVAEVAERTHEVVQRLRAEAALKMSEHRLERVLESISDGLVVVDGNWRISYINAASRQMLATQGLEADPLIGDRFFDVFTYFADRATKTLFRRAMDDREAVATELYYEPWQVWHDIRVFPVREGGLSVYFHDITAAKAAEQAMSEGQAELQRTLDSISDVFVMVDTQWRFVRINAAGRALWQGGGIDADAAIGQDIRDVFPEIVGTDFEKNLRKSLVVRVPTEFEYHFPAWGRWFACRCYPVTGNGVSLYLLDITERKAWQDRLLENEDYLGRLVDSIGNRFTVFDTQWRWRFMNADARAVLVAEGRDPQALLGTVIWETYPELLGTPFEEKLRAAMYDRHAVSLEMEMNGQWLMLNAFPIKGDGISVFGQDITGQKRLESALRDSEAQSKALNDALPQLVWTADATTGEWTYVNDRFVRYTGSPPASLLGQGFTNYIEPADRDPVVQAWAERRARGETLDVDCRLRRFDGHYCWFKVRAVPVRGADGAVRLWYGTCTDIQEMMEIRFRAESADRAKTDFLANMSHEIRTPLNAIVGLTSIMMSFKTEPEKYRQYLTTMNDSATSLTTLINEVLDYAKADAQMLELNEGELSLRAILEEVVRVTAVRAEAKGIPLELRMADTVDRFYIGDAARIKQIVTNMVANAVKFTESGRIDLIAQARDDGPGVQIAVRDTGIGIPADKLEFIFDKFTQADSSITRRFGGTGLGLAISRRLAEAMGGRISVSSRVGEGSEFTLTLPLRDAERLPESVAILLHSADNSTEGLDLSPKAKRVLVIDDNPANAVVAQAMLNRIGYECEVAATARQGIALWQDGKFGIILMDIQMPDMDGITATQRIRQMEQGGQGPRTVIIAVTAHALPEDVERCLSAGMDSFLAKPFEAKALAAKLAAMDRHKDQTGSTV